MLVGEGVRDSVFVGVGDGGVVSLNGGVYVGCMVEDGFGVSLGIGEGVGSSVVDSLGVQVRDGIGDCVGVDGVSVKAGTVPGVLSSHGIEPFRPGNEKADRKKINPASNTARAGRLRRRDGSSQSPETLDFIKILAHLFYKVNMSR